MDVSSLLLINLTAAVIRGGDLHGLCSVMLTGAGEEMYPFIMNVIYREERGKGVRKPESLLSAEYSQRFTWIQSFIVVVIFHSKTIWLLGAKRNPLCWWWAYQKLWTSIWYDSGGNVHGWGCVLMCYSHYILSADFLPRCLTVYHRSSGTRFPAHDHLRKEKKSLHGMFLTWFNPHHL